MLTRDELPNEADKIIYDLLESVAEGARQEKNKTNEESIKDELGDISNEFMDVLLGSVTGLFMMWGSAFSKEGDTPQQAMSFACMEVFREGVRLGKKLGIAEGQALPRLD